VENPLICLSCLLHLECSYALVSNRIIVWFPATGRKVLIVEFKGRHVTEWLISIVSCICVGYWHQRA